MSPKLEHECTRIPVTALSCCGPLFIAAEGPLLRFYECQDFTNLASKQIFRAQAIHGICIISDSAHHVKLIIWGGLLVRALEFDLFEDEENGVLIEKLRMSDVSKAPDWILDLCSAPVDHDIGISDCIRICAAVTAHNALLELTIHYDLSSNALESAPMISIRELTSSSRSILYSAHLIWDTKDSILVAAGTAFGEIMYWSWNRNSSKEAQSRVHSVFLGHEGSIFGVQISKKLNKATGYPQRLLASCSDDRTIRIWDVSDLSSSSGEDDLNSDIEAQRTRHTGFSNASFDSVLSSTNCLAIGWAHISRVWTVRFLDVDPSTGVFLHSSGEDATSRTWRLVPEKVADITNTESLPFKLLQLDSAGYHSGKNIWSIAVRDYSSKLQQVIMGGADSKISVCLMKRSIPRLSSTGIISTEYTIEDVASSAQTSEVNILPNVLGHLHKSSKKAEFFRSYTFIDDFTFLLTTNLGKVYLQSTLLDSTIGNETGTYSKLIEQLDDLTGYSVCTSVAAINTAFVAGSRGSIYSYRRSMPSLTNIHTVKGKVGDMFTTKVHDILGTKSVFLLVTIVGQDIAQLLHTSFVNDDPPVVSAITTIPISEVRTGLAITNMEYISTSSRGDYLLLGFRRGSIAIYHISSNEAEGIGSAEVSLIRLIERVHDKEAVTSMAWTPSAAKPTSGYLVSTGRNGCLNIHSIDLVDDSVYLVHNLALPVGPNIEGICSENDRLLVYGFSSKRYVLYDTATEEEIMSIDTGGAHRSWAFQPNSQGQGGGTLVWTRASSMHVCRQAGPNHRVIRSGGHGREIKAVAVLHPDVNDNYRQLIATGAEDTDIRIFEYEGGELICKRTLRKHTTGIQHLQWSEDGDYLFSSGGCEEFYIWRVRILPAEMGGIGVVCESVCRPENENSDLRIMSFDVRKRGRGFTIALVFSDSNIKVYSYKPGAEQQWHALAKGVYFTSCLTQCAFLSPDVVLTAGTDGHAVLWPLGQSIQSSSAEKLIWKQPARIHQSASKTLATHPVDSGTTLIVSGGDDGSLAFLLAAATPSSDTLTADSSFGVTYAYPPIIETRTHASAVTACTIVTHQSRIYILTSGNDQWVRLWEVIPQLRNNITDTEEEKGGRGLDPLEIRRLKKVKTSVADVSSMAVLVRQKDGDLAKVLICGVGMEIIRVEWGG